LTAVQIVTLFVGTPTLAYLFFSLILIAASAAAVWYAWNWSDPVTRIALSGNSPAHDRGTEAQLQGQPNGPVGPVRA
jgi:hypothetical protein